VRKVEEGESKAKDDSSSTINLVWVGCIPYRGRPWVVEVLVLVLVVLVLVPIHMISRFSQGKARTRRLRDSL